MCRFLLRESAVSDDAVKTRRGPRKKNPMQEMFAINEQQIWKRIQMAHDLDSGRPIHQLCTKWAARRRPIGINEIIEIVHAAGRFHIRFSPHHLKYFTNSLQSRSSGIHKESVVGKLLYPLHKQGFNAPVRDFIGALAPKVGACAERYSERTFTAFQGMRELKTCDPTDSLIFVLAGKITETEETLSGHTLSRMIYGVQSMDPSDAVQKYLTATSGKLRELEGKDCLSIGDLAYAYYGLSRLSHCEPGNEIVSQLSTILESNTEIPEPSAVGMIVSGLRRPPPKNVASSSEIQTAADSEVDRALVAISSRILDVSEPLDARLNETLLEVLPNLGHGPGARQLWLSLATWMQKTSEARGDASSKRMRRKAMLRTAKWASKLPEYSELGELTKTVNAEFSEEAEGRQENTNM
eukprot:jgi/Bigna1/136345/aug1.33_g11053